ncbi:MAG: 2OG-Fe(II) oxygenase [Wenzhouxiangella sp.]|nr:2OG-Fe(II) oxygenase [Wenzhouxiangella sp.]
MPASVISTEVVADAPALATSYRAASPFRHLVIDGFFQPDFCSELVERFPSFDERRAMDENGNLGAKCSHEDLVALGGPWLAIDRLIRSTPFLRWLGQVSGIENLLYDPHYFGGGTHENRHGQDLDPHVDFNRHPITGWHRRLNLIVYLNEIWDANWGGAIEFHRDPRLPPDQNEVKRVQPLFNRAVLFETTHWSWHGFERIDLPEGAADGRSRKSLALYFYSHDRPHEEQTAPHSTIYVDRPLPAQIQPGQVLSESEYADILRLLARRDQHLQRLYAEISKLNQQLENTGPNVLGPRAASVVGRLRSVAVRILRRIGLW